MPVDKQEIAPDPHGPEWMSALDRVFDNVSGLDVPLSARLRQFAMAVEEMNPPLAATVNALVTRLHASGAGTTAPDIGEPMPPFSLPDQEGRLVSLDSLLKDGPLAIVFLRGHWCHFCRLTLNALVNAEAEIHRTGGRPVFITPDTVRFTRHMAAEANAPWRFLTDVDNGYALSLNLAVWMDAEMRRLMADSGWNLPRFQGNDSWTLPIPAAFVVDSGGIIRARSIDPDYTKRMDVEDLVEALAMAG